MKKIKIPAASKVILIIISIVCILGGILPWMGYMGVSTNMMPVTPYYLTFGLVPAVLSLIAIISKAKIFNTLSNVFAILGGLAGTALTVLFSVDMRIFEHFSTYINVLQVGYWFALLSCPSMIIFAIISMCRTKSLNKSDKKPERK